MANDWLREEIVLICSALRANDWEPFRAHDEQAIALSVLLNDATFIPVDERGDAFRSPNSIQRKAYDVVTLLPSYAGSPTKGGRTTREVLEDFLADPNGMEQRAAEIRAAIVTSG